MASEQKPKRRYRRRELCVHNFGFNECGIMSGGIHWQFKCVGPCEQYEPRKAQKRKTKGGQP
jgi:hypothetical protein